MHPSLESALVDGRHSINAALRAGRKSEFAAMFIFMDDARQTLDDAFGLLEKHHKDDPASPATKDAD